MSLVGLPVPRVSVIMTAYGDLRFISVAVDSVLSQTLNDFELIIVDDGTNEDALFGTLAARDPRIRVLRNPENVGAAAAANCGIAHARADLIARLDADDICAPTRLERQVTVLEAEPDLVLLGSSVTLINESGEVLRNLLMPDSDLAVRWTILFHNPFFHPTVVFRRTAFEAAGCYRAEERVSHDHYLWHDMLPLGGARNLPEPLVRYRINPLGLTAQGAASGRSRTHPIRQARWAAIGLDYDLHDNDRARPISAVLRGECLPRPQRLSAYSVIAATLCAFRRANAAGWDRDRAGRHLSRSVVRQMVETVPLSLAAVPMLRACLALDRNETVRGLGRRLLRHLSFVGRQNPANSYPTPVADLPPSVSIDLGAWYAGKSFSSDWTSRHTAVWAALLAPRRHEPLEVLEIGAWEGRSALFFLNCLPRCRLTSIDTFAGSPEHHANPKWSYVVGEIEARFDANTAAFVGRLDKIKSRSDAALPDLALQGRRFDVALIDGSHASVDVLHDALLVWPMLRPGGLMIFDDYDWNQDLPERDRPKAGVDLFLLLHAGAFVERHRGYQMVIEKPR